MKSLILFYRYSKSNYYIDIDILISCIGNVTINDLQYVENNIRSLYIYTLFSTK